MADPKTPADLKHWTTVATTSGAELHGIAYGNNRWVAVGGAMSPSDYSITGSVIYDSTDGHEWTKVATFSDPYLLTSVAYGNGKWIAATVHAGMGYDHAILLIEAHGNKIINLKVPGCRPCLSPDGKQIAWASTQSDGQSHKIVAANADGTDLKTVSHGDGDDYQPAWSIVK